MTRKMLELLDTTPPDRPVLIAGPTASGKSSLALAIARAQGGTVVNADALQVFADWRLLTARPTPEEEAEVPHALYGHVPWEADRSVGDWLREIAPLLAMTRPIVVGGTGLYFRALTEGLADIPATPSAIRAEAQDRLARIGLDAMAAELDPDVRADLDLRNPMRVIRAWEVERATGRSIRDWQADTPPPLLPLARATLLVLDAPAAWLDPRIARRFGTSTVDGRAVERRIAQCHAQPLRVVACSRYEPFPHGRRVVGRAKVRPGASVE